MFFLQTNWIIAFVFAFVLYGAGKKDQSMTSRDTKDRSLLWAGLSIAVSALVIQVLGGGWILVVVGQLALFAGIAAFRAYRER